MSSSSPGSGENSYHFYKVDLKDTIERNHGDCEQESNAGELQYETETDSDDESTITLTSSDSCDDNVDEFEQFAAYKGTGKVKTRHNHQTVGEKYLNPLFFLKMMDFGLDRTKGTARVLNLKTPTHFA